MPHLLESTTVEIFKGYSTVTKELPNHVSTTVEIFKGYSTLFHTAWSSNEDEKNYC